MIEDLTEVNACCLFLKEFLNTCQRQWVTFSQFEICMHFVTILSLYKEHLESLESTISGNKMNQHYSKVSHY